MNYGMFGLFCVSVCPNGFFFTEWKLQKARRASAEMLKFSPPLFQPLWHQCLSSLFYCVPQWALQEQRWARVYGVGWRFARLRRLDVLWLQVDPPMDVFSLWGEKKRLFCDLYFMLIRNQPEQMMGDYHRCSSHTLTVPLDSLSTTFLTHMVSVLYSFL